MQDETSSSSAWFLEPLSVGSPSWLAALTPDYPAYGHVERVDLMSGIPVMSPAPTSRQLSMTAGVDDLAAIRRFVTDSVFSFGLGAAVAHDLTLISHEIATNLIRHGGNSSPVEIAFAISAVDRGACLTVHDWLEPFDPRSAIPHATCTLPGEPAPGGFGLRIVTQLADELEYVSTPDGNCLTILVREQRTDRHARRSLRGAQRQHA